MRQLSTSNWIFQCSGYEKPVPNDLEEAAEEYEKNHTYQRYDGGGLTQEYNATLAESFIAGAKWQAEQDDKELSEKIASAYQLGLVADPEYDHSFDAEEDYDRYMDEVELKEIAREGN